MNWTPADSQGGSKKRMKGMEQNNQGGNESTD
jgi:hypothetical protein